MKDVAAAVVKDVAAAVVRICFELTLSCAVSLWVKRFFPAHPAERFCAKWEGEGDVDYDVFAKECIVERRHSGKDVSERHHPSRAELGPMPPWVVRMVTGRVLGSGWVPGEDCLMLV